MIFETLPGILICLIPIVAIVMTLGTGMLAIYFGYRKRKEMFALYHQERMAAIEKGIELPPLPEDFFHDDSHKKPRRRASHATLLCGLILSFFSLALYLALHLTIPRTDNGGDIAIYALIPVSIGLACLVYYFVVGRKMAAIIEAERKVEAEKSTRPRNPQA